MSSGQDLILRALAENGGTCAHVRLAPVCYGRRRADLSVYELRAMHSLVSGLQRRGLLTIDRNWGTGGFGQPELVRLTASGLESARN